MSDQVLRIGDPVVRVLKVGQGTTSEIGVVCGVDGNAVFVQDPFGNQAGPFINNVRFIAVGVTEEIQHVGPPNG